MENNMYGKFKLKNYDDIDTTLELTMPLHEWREFYNQLSTKEHPSWRIGVIISKMLKNYFYDLDEKIES